MYDDSTAVLTTRPQFVRDIRGSQGGAGRGTNLCVCFQTSEKDKQVIRIIVWLRTHLRTHTPTHAHTKQSVANLTLLQVRLKLVLSYHEN